MVRSRQTAGHTVPVSTPTPPARARARNAQRLTRASGRLSSAALSRMETEMPWVTQLPAEDRSWIGLIVQAGIKSFIDWYRHGESAVPISAEVFGVAPQEMAGEISLEQTVAMVRLSVIVVDENLDDVLGADAEQARAALNQYAREIAFATAEVYARAAEQRGAWDARLEALLVDAVLRGEEQETIGSRASAAGWADRGRVLVMMGRFSEHSALDQIRRAAEDHKLSCLCAVQGDRLVVVLGGVDRIGRPSAGLADAFGPGPVVIGPVVDSLGSATRSAEAARSALRVIDGWPEAPRPVLAEDLLPERVLAGDEQARLHLLREIHAPLREATGADLLPTLERYLACGGSIEATARALYVHANTVRYRLRRITELTGRAPADPRDSYVLQVALTLGRLAREDL